MTSATFVIRRATTHDVKIITDLIDQAGEWLQGKGTDQWARPWPNAEGREHRICDGIRDGSTWIAWDSEKPIATVSIIDTANPLLWSERERRQPAVYLHRLVIDRAYAHRKLGAHIIDWAGEWGRREYRADVMRIDVWASNAALHAYYLQLGFRFLDVEPGSAGGEVVPIPRKDMKQWPSGVVLERDLPNDPFPDWPNTDRFTLVGEPAPPPIGTEHQRSTQPHTAEAPQEQEPVTGGRQLRTRSPRPHELQQLHRASGSIDPGSGTRWDHPTAQQAWGPDATSPGRQDGVTRGGK